MNHIKAFELLEIDIPDKELTLTYLKNKYRKQALRHHPDKNGNTSESTEQFKQIREAYEYLEKEIENGFDDEEPCTTSSLYMDILRMFMKGLMDGKYNELIIKIVEEIVVSCKVSMNLFEDLDKESILSIYTFLSKYRSVFHLNEKILEKIYEIILEKGEYNAIYKLNPSIDDLLENNIYKLILNDNMYLVPLWHTELYFDTSGCEFIVLCEPELENMTIDDEGNLYLEIDVSFNIIEKSFQGEKDIRFFIGKKECQIPISRLYIQKVQYYRIPKQGIAKINETDIYDITQKADIIVKITLK
jgi:hypothetical protein